MTVISLNPFSLQFGSVCPISLLLSLILLAIAI